jgi:hypothetical protein
VCCATAGRASRNTRNQTSAWRSSRETGLDYLVAIDGRHGAVLEIVKESYMIDRFFLASIVAAAALAATAPAHAGGPDGSGGQNGISLKGTTVSGPLNGTAFDDGGTRGAAQPQSQFTIAGVIVPQ